jgi:hypothetical protein
VRRKSPTSFIDEICARELKHHENQFSYIVGYFDAEPVRLETCCSKYAFAAIQAYGGPKLNEKASEPRFA